MLSKIRGKRDLSDLVSLLRINGCWYEFHGKYANVLLSFQKTRFFYFIVFSVVIFISSYKTGIRNVLNRYFFMVSGGFYVTLQAIIYYIRADKVKRIVEKIKNIHQKQTEQWEWEFFDHDSRQIWIIAKFYSASAFIFVLMYYTCPFAYDVCLVIFTSDGRDRQPFSFPYPLEDLAKKERNLAHYSVWLATFLWTAVLMSFGFASLLFQIIVCSYCCTQIRILRMFISNAEKQKLHNNKTFFKKLITDHQNLLSVIDDAQYVIGPALAAQSAIGSLLLTAYIYKMTIIKDDIALLMVNVIFFSIMVFVMFFSCSIGEMLQTEGAKLFESLCVFSWDEMTPQTRKNFGIILLQTRRPIIISFKGLLPVNLETFQFVLNSSYSFLMLLNSMK